MSVVVAAISRYCEVECIPRKRCLDCVFVDFVPRVADHLAGKGKANVVRIEEWKKRKAGGG